MGFVERNISIAIKLAQASGAVGQPPTFAESGTDQVTFRGSRTSVRIQNSGAAASSQAQVAVWGLTPSLMNQLSTLGMVISMIPRNTMTIVAGDLGGPMSTVYIGVIVQAWADLNAAPDVPIRFELQSGAAEAVIPFPASSFTGATDVATILSGIANKMGWGFENNGVSAQLPTPYLAGSAMEQVRRVAEAARINAQLINNVLCIWPLFGSRNSGGIPLIAPRPLGQMIGTPTYTHDGIQLRTIFDPRITFGGQIQVQSAVAPRASGLWVVHKLDHALDALVPKGEWASTIQAWNPNFQKPIPRG